jgi:UDP-glucose 4-epimerase
MPGTYIVTGGAGFIGSHLAERLVRDGHQVRILDNLSTGKRANIRVLETLSDDYTFHQVDIREGSALAGLMRGADAVFHLAALPSVQASLEDPLATHAHCATATLNVLQAARVAGVRRVVYAGSSSAYGQNDASALAEPMAPAPVSPYGVAKLAGEYYCQTYAASMGVETAVLRYFNVYGPRQNPASGYAAVIPTFITAILKGDAVTIHGDGEQTRDFVHVDDVVSANLLAATVASASGQVFNIASGQATSINQLVDTLDAVMGATAVRQHEAARAGDIRHSRADITRAREVLGFSPRVALEQGLLSTVTWYREQDTG